MRIFTRSPQSIALRDVEQGDGFHPACRFAAAPNVGPNSHFFTVSQDECAVVRDRADWHWQFEGVPFWAMEPANRACTTFTKALYRAFNNGKEGTPKRPYSTDPLSRRWWRKAG